MKKPSLGQWANPLQIKKDAAPLKTKASTVPYAPIPLVGNSKIREQRWLAQNSDTIDILIAETIDRLGYIDRDKFNNWLVKYTTI
jgi:hypothetical protein